MRLRFSLRGWRPFLTFSISAKYERRRLRPTERQKFVNKSAEQARTQDVELLDSLQKGFKYIENESFDSTFKGLFSEINLGSEKLGKKNSERNARLCKIVGEIAKGLAEFSTNVPLCLRASTMIIMQL